MKRLGLDPALTFHGLRHVAASLMVEQGEHPRVIQARLGHATSRLSMERYAHVPEAADRQVAAHLDAGWASATTRTQRARSPYGASSNRGIGAPTAWSEAVEVSGLEPPTSTLRTSPGADSREAADRPDSAKPQVEGQISLFDL